MDSRQLHVLTLYTLIYTYTDIFRRTNLQSTLNADQLFNAISPPSCLRTRQSARHA